MSLMVSYAFQPVLLANTKHKRIRREPIRCTTNCTSKTIKLHSHQANQLSSKSSNEHSNSNVNTSISTSGSGKFGKYGGRYVLETLISPLNKLENEFNLAMADSSFQQEFTGLLKDYAGRETPLYFAESLTNYYKNLKGEGPQIYLKREDLNHTGSYKINNVIGQALLAKRMRCKTLITATGGGQQGVATAAICAKLSLECTIHIGTLDMEMECDSVLQMKLFGAQVIFVEGNFMDAASEAFRSWVGKVETSYYLCGTGVSPHPVPSMVREFQSVIGKEIRKQSMEKWAGKPDVLIACVGGGSNAMGMFHEFLGDKDVRLIGVEAGGLGLKTGKHCATLGTGQSGVYHGSMSYLLQDEEGQIIVPHSLAAGLQCPGVSPELSFLKDSGRAHFYSVTDEEALEAYKRLCKLEGIIPALEASHALAFLGKISPTLPNGANIVVNLSGCGDKDLKKVVKSDAVFTS